MSTHLTVTSTEQLTPRLTRVWFSSDDLSAFEGSDSTDRYVKLVFPKPGVVYPQPLDMRAMRATMPPEHLPVVRTYTALFPDVAAGTVAIDFVVHGDEGVAGPWAAAARLTLPSGAELTFVHRDAGGDLVESVRAMDWREGRVHAFVHGEGSAVMHGIRPYLLRERGLAREQVSISGYWRLGRTEEGFRDWKSELAAADGAE